MTKDTSLRRIDDPKWMNSVRDDLDSNSAAWAGPTTGSGISKLKAIGSYLDTILTELGYPVTPHACPECGKEHTPG